MPSFNLITKDINSGILDVFLEKMTWNHLEKEPKSLLELFPGFQVNLPSPNFTISGRYIVKFSHEGS